MSSSWSRPRPSHKNRAGAIYPEPQTPLLFRTRLSPGQQSSHVAEQLIRAHGTVAVLGDQPVYNLIDLAQLIGVWRLGRSRDLYHILEIGEDLLFNGLFQPLVRLVLKRLALSGIIRDADKDLLPERVLCVVAHPDLFLYRPHELLVRLE